jgi:hypothetical protein
MRRRVRAIDRATRTGHAKVIARAKAMIDAVKETEPVKGTAPAKVARQKGAKVPAARVAADSDLGLARRDLVRAALAEAVLAVSGASAVLARVAVAALMPGRNPNRETTIGRRAIEETGRKANANGLATVISPAMRLASRAAKTKRNQPA